MKPPPDYSSASGPKTPNGSKRLPVTVTVPVPNPSPRSNSITAVTGVSPSSSAASRNSSFAAALRQLAKQVGVTSDSGDTASSHVSHMRGDPSVTFDLSSKSMNSNGTQVTRSRSPPVVTIAPTLSFNGLSYQDSRKTETYNRPVHSLPNLGTSFGGGLSTGLSGLSALSALSAPAAINLNLPSTNPLNIPSSSLDFLRPRPELQPSGQMASYGHLPPVRPDELHYSGIRNNAGVSSRLEEGNFHLLPYHGSLWNSTRTAGLSDFLTASRSSAFLNYRPDVVQQQPNVLEHSSLAAQMHPSMFQHPLAAAQHNLRLEEQMYLERIGLLRTPPLMLPSPSYPGFVYPSSPYLGYRYPSPAVLPTDTTVSSGASPMRPFTDEETKEEAKPKEEERTVSIPPSNPSPVSSSPEKDTAASIQLKRGSSPAGNGTTSRRDRKRETVTPEQRKPTISLPSQFSVLNKSQAKIQAVPPLNVPDHSAAATSSRLSPNTTRLKRDAEVPPKQQTNSFSQSALEAMAMLQRNATNERVDENCDVPLDLSDISPKIEPEKLRSSSPQRVVVSLLDQREQRRRERLSQSCGENEEEDEDEDEDVGNTENSFVLPLHLRFFIETKSSSTTPQIEQLDFLRMFGLRTHREKDDIELAHCEKRQQILQEFSPIPLDSEPTKTIPSSVFPLPSSNPIMERIDSRKRDFFQQLRMGVSSESNKKDREASWSLISANRRRRNMSRETCKRRIDETSCTNERVVVKVPRLVAEREKADIDWSSLKQTDVQPTANETEISKLATEAAFWLQRLNVPLASALPKVSAKTKQNEEISDTRDQWPRVEAVMSMYMSYHQDVTSEIEYLRDYCGKLHVQLAEGQADLSRLCLTLTSLLDKQRQIQNERNNLIQSANKLQEILSSITK